MHRPPDYPTSISDITWKYPTCQTRSQSLDGHQGSCRPTSHQCEVPYFNRDFTFFKRACPLGVFPPTGQNPLTPKAFLAALVAAPHLAMTFPPLDFLAAADFFLETTLPASH